jgi:hypothetical protein
MKADRDDFQGKQVNTGTWYQTVTSPPANEVPGVNRVNPQRSTSCETEQRMFDRDPEITHESKRLGLTVTKSLMFLTGYGHVTQNAVSIFLCPIPIAIADGQFDDGGGCFFQSRL